MRVYLGLGSNLGERRAHLGDAVARLEGLGLRDIRVSPVVETPALLPPGAPSDWNRPFLNVVVRAHTPDAPARWLEHAREVEDALGRDRDAGRWAPRPIDVDLLLWGDEIVREPGLCIPHPEMHRRAFVMTPLAWLDPGLCIPGHDGRTAADLARALPQRIPLWMGIVNLTPDSFSADGLEQTGADGVDRVAQLAGEGVNIVDVGAESTRPGARPVAPDQEWRRLAPVLESLADARTQPLDAPWVSVDTRHCEVAKRSLDLGVDLINDVSGLAEPGMLELAATGEALWVAMHSLVVPADPKVRLPEGADAVDALECWLDQRLALWQRHRMDTNRIILDPGIGFGKTSLQSLELLREVRRIAGHGLRVLVGHSRKSFMQGFTGRPAAERDIETIGASLKLCERGVDVLRVHAVAEHVRAHRAWAHLEGYGEAVRALSRD